MAECKKGRRKGHAANVAQGITNSDSQVYAGLTKRAQKMFPSWY